MKIRFIQRGDFDGLLGLLVDNLSVFLLLISLNLYVVGMPAHIVFGRIIPGAAIGLLGGNLYYVWMALKLRKAQQRDDITALPSGISIVFVLVYTMGILLPVAKITGDPEMAWRIGLAANIIGALICLAGAFIGPWLRKFLPSVSMLGALAGLAVVFIAGAGLKDIYANPIIGLVCLAVIVWGYIAGEKMPFNIPAGVMALVIGAVLAVCMGQTAVSMDHVGIYAPIPWIFRVGVQAFRECGSYLAVIIPLAVINFISTLNNVESAATAGDEYNVREAMVVDAAATALGAVFGCCYPNCVFIGHPGYKRMGARLSYSLMNGVVFSVLALFGLFGLISSMIPTAAVAPILIFIGVVNIEVAFTAVPKRHIPAAAIALLPFVSEFAMEQIDSTLNAVGAAAADPATLAALIQEGLNYPGYQALGYGTILIAMILAALVVFVVERRMLKLAATAFGAAALSAVGLIHSPVLAFLPNLQITAAYALVGVLGVILHCGGVGKKENAAVQPQQN